MRIPQEDKTIINIIKSNDGEYYDDYLRNDSRERFFWNLSCVRTHSLDWYEFGAGSRVLVLGDDFGAMVGSACDKAGSVDVIVSDEQYADAILCRYADRQNLSVFAPGINNQDTSLLKYDHVIMDLEDCHDYDWNNSYVVDHYFEFTKNHLEGDAKIIVLARGDMEYHVKRILYKHGFCFYNTVDPLGNGYLFMEASKSPIQWQNIAPETAEQNRSILVENPWVKKNWIPFGGGEIFDEDINRIEEVKKVEIDLLAKLFEFCSEHDLTVYPMYGTLLGLMRDGGLIPGDDDIDVAMPREDYDKLVSLRDEFTGDYFLQTPYNDDCFFGGYLKLRNTKTTAIHPQNEFVDACEGIAIDVFPLDNVYEDAGKEGKKRGRILFLQRLLFAKSYGYFARFRDMPMLKWKAHKYFGKLFDRNKLIDKLYAKMSEGDKKSEKYAIYCHYSGDLSSTRYFDRKDFKKTFTLLYEGQQMQVPAGWESILRGLYGDFYSNRNGYSQGKRRHGFYDVNVPYTEYKRRFSGLHYPSTITEPIVIVGDGSVFKSCLSYYKSRVNVSHLVQLPGEEPMEPVMGIEVESWDEFVERSIPQNEYRLIICSGNNRAAEAFLKENGFTDYYMFWYNRDWMLYANQYGVWKEIYS